MMRQRRSNHGEFCINRQILRKNKQLWHVLCLRFVRNNKSNSFGNPSVRKACRTPDCWHGLLRWWHGLLRWWHGLLRWWHGLLRWWHKVRRSQDNERDCHARCPCAGGTKTTILVRIPCVRAAGAITNDIKSTSMTDNPMKKLLYSGIAFGLLLFVLVAIWGVFVMYQRHVLKDDMLFFTTRWQDGFIVTTEEGSREFHVVEIVCKHKDPFNVSLELDFNYLENEREDGLQHERIDLPERPAKRSNGIWMTRFYVLGAEDGAIGVFDAMPTQETVQNGPEILKSLVPYAPPQMDIPWYCNSSGLSCARPDTARQRYGQLLSCACETFVRRLA